MLPTVSALLQASHDAARPAPCVESVGRVVAVDGVLVRAKGLAAGIGALCSVVLGPSQCETELVAFDGADALLMPYGPLRGIAPGMEVRTGAAHVEVPAGPACLGRVLDGLGRPLDGLGPVAAASVPTDGAAPDALSRPLIRERLHTGVAAIDAFLTVGRGQRVGIFAGSGVGKSTLLASIARASDADVNVIALIGERGREVQEFLHDVLGPEGLARSVLVVATSDMPALVRARATETALTIAESFRDAGQHVLLTMDSITRYANAQREIGLAVGEPPTMRGYPPSFFARLPRLVERLGATERGSITGLLTVLVDGDDMNEPVADTLRGLLDGHIVLDRALAHRGAYPAISVLESVSRLMPRLVAEDELADARRLREVLALLEETRELVQVGAYQPGMDARLDAALALRADLEAFLYHGSAVQDPEALRSGLRMLAARAGSSR